jgi:hypothetical protein
MADENKILTLTPIALTLLRQVMAFITAERARTGLTYEEIFAQAASQLDANEAALKADLEG